MDPKGVFFDDEARLAKYIVELTKLGAAYTVTEYGPGFVVIVTGF